MTGAPSSRYVRSKRAHPAGARSTSMTSFQAEVSLGRTPTGAPPRVPRIDRQPDRSAPELRRPLHRGGTRRAGAGVGFRPAGRGPVRRRARRPHLPLEHRAGAWRPAPETGEAHRRREPDRGRDRKASRLGPGRVAALLAQARVAPRGRRRLGRGGSTPLDPPQRPSIVTSKSGVRGLTVRPHEHTAESQTADRPRAGHHAARVRAAAAAAPHAADRGRCSACCS